MGTWILPIYGYRFKKPEAIEPFEAPEGNITLKQACLNERGLVFGIKGVATEPIYDLTAAEDYEIEDPSQVPAALEIETHFENWLKNDAPEWAKNRADWEEKPKRWLIPFT